MRVEWLESRDWCNDTMTGINWSQIPVVILEMGFMTNQQDDTNMSDATYRELMVDGIVDGINAYYGFEFFRLFYVTE